jgi:hypothetical protein
MAMPQNISVTKVVALVIAFLAKVQNFLLEKETAHHDKECAWWVGAATQR